MLYVDTKLWLPDDLLARGDKTSMAASLEARVPLLDHRLVEFAAVAAARPQGARLHAQVPAASKVAREWLPAQIIDRRKKGFPVPMAAWLRGEARDVLPRPPVAADGAPPGAASPGGVGRGCWTSTRAARPTTGSLLWALLSLELWHRVYLDGARTAAPRPVAHTG